jgi:hypothetical protein
MKIALFVFLFSLSLGSVLLRPEPAGTTTPASSVVQVTPPAPPFIPAGFLRDPSDWAAIPTSGLQWTNILNWAEMWDDGLNPDVTEATGTGPDDNHDVATLACALAWRGTGSIDWLDRARMLIGEAVAANPPAMMSSSGSALEPGRNLLSYVLAANMIDLSVLEPGPAGLDERFRSWILTIAEVNIWTKDAPIPGGTFRFYHERRPNNIGLVVGAARIAVDMYLGGPVHSQHIVDAKNVCKGFMGNDTSYNFLDSDFGGPSANIDNSWQENQGAGDKEGINPVGATSNGNNVDGCLPDDMRRLNDASCASCAVNPSIVCYNRADSIDGGTPAGIDATNYPWEGLQGLVMQAYLLSRCGWASFSWEMSAVERTHKFLYLTYGLRAQDTWDDPTQGDNPACCNGTGNRNNVDDTWVPWIIKAIYNSNFLIPPGQPGANLVHGGKPGKNCGFADWWTIGL